MSRRHARTLAEVWQHILAMSEPGADDCIQFGGYVKKDGYGYKKFQGRIYSVHRLAYEANVGPIPDRLTLDHLCHTRSADCLGGPCRHRSCVNPAHLEPVTMLENSLRSTKSTKSHCDQGHEFTPENTQVATSNGRSWRACRTCNRAAAARYRERKRAAA